MPSGCLVMEEYGRLLNAFTARLVRDYRFEAYATDETSYDALRLLPVSSIAPSVDRLLSLPTDVPIEWRVAEYLGEHASDLMTVRALNSMRIGEALDVAYRNHRIQTNVRTITHSSRNDGRLVAVHHTDKAHDPLIRFLFRTFIATKLYLFFKFYGGSEKQHEVDTRASCFGALMRRFDRELDFIDIEFRDEEITFDFCCDALAYKLADPNDLLIASLDRELRRKEAEIPAMGSWKDRIKHHIRSNHLSNISLDELCDTFRVQRRTLGRLLRDEGTTFTAMLTELRRERALHLVRNTGVPLKRVAAELGFNSDASFNMAFKSWTGTTPMKFRKVGPDQIEANFNQPRVTPPAIATVTPICQLGGVKMPGRLGPRWTRIPCDRSINA